MNRHALFSIFFIAVCLGAYAQKPFTEGTIIYKVKLLSPDNKEVAGIYTFTFKGSQIKKELKLNNGFQDVVIMNCGTSSAYSLKSGNGRKYAIQLSMADIIKNQQRFAGYAIRNEKSYSKNIAGYATYKGNINYRDGSASEVYYTKEWSPSQSITYDRFPDAKFLPLNYSYKDDAGMTMQFEAEKVESGPVENSAFRIPSDYKMISYEEYKQLMK